MDIVLFFLRSLVHQQVLYIELIFPYLLTLFALPPPTKTSNRLLLS